MADAWPTIATVGATAAHAAAHDNRCPGLPGPTLPCTGSVPHHRRAVLVVVLVGSTAFTLKATHGRHTLFLNTQHHWMVNNNLARIFPMDTDDGHVGWPVMGCVPQRTRPCKCCQLVLSPLFWTSSDPFTFCNATTSSILPLLWMDVRCYF